MGVRGGKYSGMNATGSSVIKHRLIRGVVVNPPPPPPRGFVPISVGTKHEKKLRFMVHTTALGDSDFLEFLGRSAEEYGLSNQGILRFPYEARSFEEWVKTSNNAPRPKMLGVRRNKLD